MNPSNVPPAFYSHGRHHNVEFDPESQLVHGLVNGINGYGALVITLGPRIRTVAAEIWADIKAASQGDLNTAISTHGVPTFPGWRLQGKETKDKAIAKKIIQNYVNELLRGRHDVQYRGLYVSVGEEDEVKVQEP